MNKLELIAESVPMLKPALSRLGEEAATAFMSAARSGRVSGFVKDIADSEAARDLEAYLSKPKSRPVFKTSDDLKLFRSADGEPRRLSFDRDFRIKGGTVGYRTLDGDSMQLEFPSLQELQHSPVGELSELVRHNQGQLLKAVEAAPPSDLPKLGWHGTSGEGADFLWRTKNSQSYASGTDAPLWFNTVDGEAGSGSRYLSDIQGAMSPSRNIYPGTTINEADPARHEMFVVDTSKTGTWRWDFNENVFRQHTFDPEWQIPWAPHNEHIGAPAQKVGRRYAPVTPQNFNDRILGSFVNAPPTTKLDVPRNYFDKYKYERLNVANVFGLQEDTAQTLDLGGVIRRFK